jgi:class 3 adenylate cyclase
MPPTHALTAAFIDPALEAEFQAAYFELEVKRYTRFSLAVATVFFLGYGIHDAFFLGELRERAWMIRYAIFLPIAVAVLVFARTRAYARFQQPAALVFGMAVNLVVLWIGAIAPPTAFVLYTSYAVLFVTLGPFIAKMNVATQSLYTLLSSALFLFFAATVSHPDAAVTVSMAATIVCIGAIGAIVARAEQLQSRRVFIQRQTIATQMEELDVERAKSEALLLNILPSSIATRLKSSAGAIADGFPEVTVLFADIVGFTKLSARMSPEALVRGLNEMFSTFDDLADSLGVEKIKTIGDAYMAVAGLHGDKDHAQTIAEMALGMVRGIAKFNRFDEPINVRIGIHTGPAVAGVIGKKKFIYDVWGDTVNTASRMESHGVPGEVHVTEATHALLEREYDFEARGEIEVKGKGVMRTWFVRGKKPLSA